MVRRYIINFIEDYSRKCWIYFLIEKFKIFIIFKEFKDVVEKEMIYSLVCLRIYRGGEYNFKVFGE